MEATWARIASSRRLTTSGRHILPTGALDTILPMEVIAACVDDIAIAHEDRIGLVASISTHSKTLFAILIWMRRGNAIIRLRQHRIFDSSLPLDEQLASRIVPEFAQTLVNDVQWEFVPFRFRADMCEFHNIIRQTEVLPFIGEKQIGHGGYGDVLEMTIARSEQDFFPHEDLDPRIVRKRLRTIAKTSQSSSSRHTEPYHEEMVCLRLLHRLKHPNIIELLGSYTYKGEHNFLFPCLEQDLEKFLNADSRPDNFRDEHDIIAALQGLASALENVHTLDLDALQHGVEMRSIGYHHDLRPENVLVHNGTFVLADFGLAKIKERPLGSATDWKAGNGDYIAPECMQKDFIHGRIGRGIDVWAFGCLTAEVMTYLTYGKDGIRDFRESRSSAEFMLNWEDQYFFGRKGVKTAVLEWFEKLTADTSMPAMEDIISVTKSMLRVDPSQRSPISSVAIELAIIHLRCLFAEAKRELQDLMIVSENKTGIEINTMTMWFQTQRLEALNPLFEAPLSTSRLRMLLEGSNSFYSEMRRLLRSLSSALHSAEQERGSSTVPREPGGPASCTLPIASHLEPQIRTIWDLLPASEQRWLEHIWRRRCVMTDNAQELRTRLVDDSDPIASTQQREIKALATMRTLRLQLSRRQIHSSGLRYLCSYDDLKQYHNIHQHAFGEFKGTPVLIEWEYYSEKWDTIPIDEKLKLMALKAESFGTAFKPEQLKILDCVGFVEGPASRPGYGFLYKTPSPFPLPHWEGQFTTLLTLITKDLQAKEMKMQPDLRSKLQLAADLVTCLSQLHETGWLHEHINSNNIVFFPNSSKDGTHEEQTIAAAAARLSPSFHSAVYQNPYLVDFRNSRPDSKVCFTMGPMDDEYDDYHHPLYTRNNRYRPIFDYYSLGIVLLEIGLWYPLSSMKARYPTGPPEGLRDVLVNTYAPRLGARMGLVYRDAVLACLEGVVVTAGDHYYGGDSTAATISNHMDEFNSFVERVVEPLEYLSRLRL